MKTEIELRRMLREIDHKGYPAYKGTKGNYRFPKYVLSIDHVQGDPFAAPSKISIHIEGKDTGFDTYFYDSTCKRIAFQDYLLRGLARQIREYSFKAKGSGKSGLLGISQPGQEILERSACVINPKDGKITVQIEVGFPANGRTINAGELEKILFDFLPKCIEKTLYVSVHRREQMEQVVHLAEDQQYIRKELKKKKLVAFVANGAILPRKSGVSMQPMKDAVPFQSTESMEVIMELPHYGSLKGMGVPRGITLIVGGGYHGKSTLLKALELGVYNHIKGDGREYVITDETAMKLRAEDGRSIQKVDISMFINHLPNKKDTVSFYTEDASGSTSQAANTVEAMEAGAEVFLIDEDTSATNFMIRDELMQRVVVREMEPIIPFIDRVRELYENRGISTILVAGSSGAYFKEADTVIQMKEYMPMEITELAKKEAAHFPAAVSQIDPAERPKIERIIKRDSAFRKETRIKTKTMGRESFSINKENVDLRLVEQLVDSEQLNSLAQIVKYMKLHIFDGKKTLGQGVEELWEKIEQQGIAVFCEGTPAGNLTLPRKQEIYAALNRCRNLIKVE